MSHHATPDIHVLLLATDDTPPSCQNMVNSLKLHGYEYSLLGLGQRWQGFRWRMQQYAAAAAGMPPNTVVVCVDAYDAVAVQNASVLLRRFLDMEARLGLSVYEEQLVVLGGEPLCGSNCVALTAEARTFLDFDTAPPQHQQRLNVNGGFVCGWAPAVAAMYTAALALDIEDDQVALGTLMHNLSAVKAADPSVPPAFVPTMDWGHQLIYNVNYDFVLGIYDHGKGPKPAASATGTAGANATGTGVSAGATSTGDPDTPCFVHVPGIQRKLDARPYNAWVRQAIGDAAQPIQGSLRQQIACWLVISAVGMAAAATLLGRRGK